MTSPSEFDDKQRRKLFSTQAKTYGDGRPAYPPEVFEYLASSCGLAPGRRVLEIGPGSGQATGALLDAGASVIAIETGEEFVAHLRDTFVGRELDARVADFETVDLARESFDLVVAATSFHWIPPQAGLNRVADVLRPGGFVALWWHHFGDPDRPDPFRQAVQPILMRYAPDFAENSERGGAGIGAHPYALDASTRVAEIDDSGRFGPVNQFVTSWTATHTAAQVRQFLASFSHWMALEENTARELLDAIKQLVETEFGGVVQRPFLTAVYSAERL